MLQFFELFIILVITNQVSAFVGDDPLNGKYQPCDVEGAKVEVPKTFVGNNHCLSCFCKNGIVQCKPLECPSVQGCYRLQKKRNNECCHSCLGCLFNGTLVAHGSSWVDNCNVHQCEAGVLTSSNTQCFAPCHKPISSLDENKCCPRCKGCWLDGELVPEQESRSPRHSPCIQCSCDKDILSCKKRTCPVLSCPPHKAVPDEGGCCLKCNGSREIFVLPNKRCFLGRYLYQSGDRRTYDQCTNCTCNSGFLTCIRQTCPILQCPKEYHQIKRGQCCAQCVYPKRYELCFKDGNLRQHGEKWFRDQCTQCNCHEGRVTCEAEHCKYANKECPAHFESVMTNADCCPRCVERTGVCVTYGDPHYKTFDGYKFDFQGDCRYELASDCLGRKFSVRVNNDARKTSYFSWTRSLSLKLILKGRKYKISLGQKLRVKVNKRRVKLPFMTKGINITKDGFSLTVSTSLGVQVTWNGASYVEIQVAPEWRNRTCGLCGNFNRNATDDKLTKSGEMSTTDQQMANSWQSGKASTCSRRLRRLRSKEKDPSQMRFQRLSCFNSHSESRNRCDILNHTYFDQCKTKVPSHDFYKSCLLDLCECPLGRMSECDAMLAFQRECQQFGFDMSDWRKVSKCGGFECPYGAMFMTCAPACRPTCKNPQPNMDCYKRKCQPGCYCPPSTVLHRGTCILPEKCPRKQPRGKY